MDFIAGTFTNNPVHSYSQILQTCPLHRFQQQKSAWTVQGWRVPLVEHSLTHLKEKQMLAQPKKCARAHVSVAKLHHHVTLVRQDIN